MTDNNELYLELIFAAISEVNIQQPPEYQLKLNKDEFLISDKSCIDSLGLITLLINIEEKVSNKFKKNLNLLDEKFISEENTPFKTLGSLASWLNNNV
jgi:D-alanine--poly(phosphoribitol) ligase subunit 2